MCKSIKDCLFCRCPPTSSCCARKWSQDATKQARNSSQHRIRDFGVGLLAVPVENTLNKNKQSINIVSRQDRVKTGIYLHKYREKRIKNITQMYN